LTGTPIFRPSHGVPRKSCPLSIRWALYKNQSLVSVLPYADIGVIGVIVGFDEGDPLLIQYPRSVEGGHSPAPSFIDRPISPHAGSPHR
jgi:hypothetical protein